MIPLLARRIHDLRRQARGSTCCTLLFSTSPMRFFFLTLLVCAMAIPAHAESAKLPLTEIPATAGSSDTFVVFISGDGGWAAIDREIAKVLARSGMPVVGLNALQYFWTPRTPDSASRDLQWIVSHYMTLWGKSRVVLAGYSRGADVLPAMISRLPATTQSRVRLIALLGPSPNVEFEFHMSDWLKDSKAGVPVKPEIDKLHDRPILCLSGEDDPDSLCRKLSGPNIDIVTLRGSHHFDRAYGALGHIIIEHLK